MAKIQVTTGMLIVEQFDKRKKNTDGGSPFAHVVVSNNLGTIKFSSNPEEVGVMVYFGSQYEKLIMEGIEVIAMKTENIIAKVSE